MGLSPILSIIHTVSISTMLNVNNGNNGHGLKSLLCKKTFTFLEICHNFVDQECKVNITYQERKLRLLVCSISSMSTLMQNSNLHTDGSGGVGPSDVRPQGPNSFIFMQFSAKKFLKIG